MTVRRGRSPASHTRAALLAAAERRFSESGFSETRLEDIASDVGIQRAAIFYHFRDKQALYRAVLTDVFGELIHRAHEALTTGGAPAARIERGIEVWLSYVEGRPSVARLILREAANSQPGQRRTLLEETAPLIDEFRRVFEEGRRSGRLRPIQTDPFQFLSAVVGATVFTIAALPTLLPELPLDPLSPAAFAAHRRDVHRIARRLLGVPTPRPAARPQRPSTAGRQTAASGT
ncbi:MAG: TetR/AcrR family transcriptional regulator [Myxococcota bacterium]